MADTGSTQSALKNKVQAAERDQKSAEGNATAAEERAQRARAAFKKAKKAFKKADKAARKARKAAKAAAKTLAKAAAREKKAGARDARGREGQGRSREDHGSTRCWQEDGAARYRQEDCETGGGRSSAQDCPQAHREARVSAKGAAAPRSEAGGRAAQRTPRGTARPGYVRAERSGLEVAAARRPARRTERSGRCSGRCRRARSGQAR